MSMPLSGRLTLCAAVALPAVAMRITGVHGSPLLNMFLFGAAIIAAAFVLGWAADAAHKDISGSLAIAVLALIAVLPEYAVDLFYAFTAASKPEYLHFAAANMTGSNRLLLGFGWPLVATVALIAAGSRSPLRRRRMVPSLALPTETRTDIAFLFLLSVLAFAIPLMSAIPLWFGFILIGVFVAYLWRASQAPVSADHLFIGSARLIAKLPTTVRRWTIVGALSTAAVTILLVAEPFAESLVATGEQIGFDSYFLVQWLAPLASEAPEFIVATMFAVHGNGAAAIGTLIASKVNQWSLLVGSLPVAYMAGGGGTTLPLDGRQIEEFVLTATQALLGVAIIMSLKFQWWGALGLFSLFVAQFVVTNTDGRYVLSAIQAAVAVVLIIAHWRQLPATFKALVRPPNVAVPSADSAGVPEVVGA